MPAWPDRQRHASEFLEALDGLHIVLSDPPSYAEVYRLAEAHDLTVYDAAYLELAQREGLPLASLAKRLNRAAATLGLELFDAKA
jgi:predicted nucleic acid-binding protein